MNERRRRRKKENTMGQFNDNTMPTTSRTHFGMEIVVIHPKVINNVKKNEE